GADPGRCARSECRRGDRRPARGAGRNRHGCRRTRRVGLGADGAFAGPRPAEQGSRAAPLDHRAHAAEDGLRQGRAWGTEEYGPMSRTPVLIAARRTPIGNAGHGFAELTVTDLAAPVLRSVHDEVRASGIEATVDDVVLGNCLGPGGD